VSSGEGNRVWRVDTPQGPLALKRYARRNSLASDLVRAGLTWLLGRKSLPTAAGRRRAELFLLRHWRAQGFDVPGVWEPHEKQLGDEHCLLLEWIDAPVLLQLLRRKADTPPAERARLLALLGAEMGRRHAHALTTDDPRLIQEHGSADHLFVCREGTRDGRPEHLVRFDHEQGFLPRQPVLPLITKEVAATLRGLAKKSDPQVFADDLRVWAEAYHDASRAAPELLRRAVDEAFHSPSRARRLVWRLDRASCERQRSPHKFDVLRALREHCARASAGRPEPQAA